MLGDVGPSPTIVRDFLSIVNKEKSDPIVMDKMVIVALLQNYSSVQ